MPDRPEMTGWQEIRCDSQFRDVVEDPFDHNMKSGLGFDKMPVEAFSLRSWRKIMMTENIETS